MAIEETKSGRWKVTVDVSAQGKDGKRQRVVRTVDTEAEAQTLHALLKGRAPELAHMSVTGLCDHYVLLHAPDLAPQTDNLYRGMIERYIRPTWFGDLAFDQVELEQVRRFYAQLRDGTYLDTNPVAKRLRKRAVRPLGDTTVRGIHVFVASVYNEAVELGWLDKAPTYRARRRKQKSDRAATAKRARRTYSLDDITAIRGKADDDLRDLMQLGIITGARIGELAALRWCDIDFAEQTVHIAADVSATRKTDPVQGGKLYRKPTTKTEDVRDLLLDDDTIAMLEQRLARHAQQAEDVGLDPRELDGRAVFTRQLEVGFTSPRALAGQFRRACEAAGVTMTFHDLRRVACSEMMAANVPVPNATARTGHASNVTYFDVYGRARADQSDPALVALAGTWERITRGG